MSRRFLTPVGLLSLASAPGSASLGDTYFDTAAGSLKTYNGSEWVGGGGAGDVFIPVTSVDGLTGDVDLSLSYDAIGAATTALESAKDYTDTAVSTIGTSLAAKAPLASPTFTGTPAAPTATQGTNTTQLATTAFVRAEVAALVGAAPGTLDTLAEIDAQLSADESIVAALTTTVGTKAPLASPTFTGSPAAPTPTTGDSSTKLATTAFVAGAVAGVPVPVAQASEPSSPVDGQIWVDTDGTAADFIDAVQANFLSVLMGAI